MIIVVRKLKANRVIGQITTQSDTNIDRNDGDNDNQ